MPLFDLLFFPSKSFEKGLLARVTPKDFTMMIQLKNDWGDIETDSQLLKAVEEYVNPKSDELHALIPILKVNPVFNIKNYNEPAINY